MAERSEARPSQSTAGPDRSTVVAPSRSTGAAATPGRPTSPIMHPLGLMALQGSAGNRAVSRLVIQRKAGQVQMADAADVMGAMALDAILHGDAGDERLGDFPAGDQAAAGAVIGVLHNRSASGGSPPDEKEKLSIWDKNTPPLLAMLDRAQAQYGGQLNEAADAKRYLSGIRDNLVAGKADAAAGPSAQDVEFQAPKARAEREELGKVATEALKTFVSAAGFAKSRASLNDEFKETAEGLETKIKTMEGVIALCDTEEWPNYQKMQEELEKQIKRTDPDWKLGVGASLVDQTKKLTDWVCKVSWLMGKSMERLASVMGMAEQAKQIGEAVEKLGAVDTVLNGLTMAHGIFVLMDGKATGAQKAEAGYEVASGGSGLVGTAAKVLTREGGLLEGSSTAGTVGTVASKGSILLTDAYIHYKAYKALTEYTYTTVIGGLSNVAVSEDLEGIPLEHGKRAGGLDVLGREVAERRMRVESLVRQLDEASDQDRAGVQKALDTEVVMLQNALYKLAQAWTSSGIPAIRDRSPRPSPAAQLEWDNSMAPGAEAGQVGGVAQAWEMALAHAFAEKEKIVDETMVDSLKYQ